MAEKKVYNPIMALTSTLSAVVLTNSVTNASILILAGFLGSNRKSIHQLSALILVYILSQPSPFIIGLQNQLAVIHPMLILLTYAIIIKNF